MGRAVAKNPNTANELLNARRLPEILDRANELLDARNPLNYQGEKFGKFQCGKRTIGRIGGMSVMT